MSSFSGDVSLLGYWRERFPWTLFAPATLFLATPALVSESTGALVRTVVLVYILVFQFRLWDDLRDLERDRSLFPARVLSRVSSMAPFRAVWIAATVTSLVLLNGRPDLQAVYTASLFLYAVWYRWLDPHSFETSRYHFRLLKYPLFAYFAAELGVPPSFVALALTLLLVYLTFVVYEPLHDSRLHGVSGADALLAVELTLWVLVANATIFVAWGRTSFVLYVLFAASAALAIVCLRRFQRKVDCTFMGRAVFLTSFIALASSYGDIP